MPRIKYTGEEAGGYTPPTAMCGRPIGLNVAVVGVLLFAVVAGAPRAGRRLQDVCRCKHCVKAGNTAQQCMAFGIDCSCLVVCKCQGCLDKGNSVKSCRSFGLDCNGCHDGGKTGSGETCGKGRCRDDPTWISTFHAACADYAPKGLSAGHCKTDSGVSKRTGDKLRATEACPVTCGTCPPTFSERQTAVTAKCCERANNCGPGHPPILCSLGCANIFLGFWKECHGELLTKYQHGITQFDGIVAKCQATSKACASEPCHNGAVCSASSTPGGHRHLQQASSGFACACRANYYGLTCAKFCTPTGTCSGKGRCRPSDGACSCQANYYGPSCATFCSAASTCSGHGACGTGGACNCEAGYTKDKHCRGA